VVQEVIAVDFGMFAELDGRGKAEVAFATLLANFAIRQVPAGRQVGTKPKLHDVLAPRAQSAYGVIVERLDTFDEEQGQWRAALVEDRHATAADIAAARIDVAAWLRSLSRRDRRIAGTLAMGETTSGVARQFQLKLGADQPAPRGAQDELAEVPRTWSAARC
jgi:hypothetical protein